MNLHTSGVTINYTVTVIIKQGIEETLYKMSKIIQKNSDSENAGTELDKFITLIDAEKRMNCRQKN